MKAGAEKQRWVTSLWLPSPYIRVFPHVFPLDHTHCTFSSQNYGRKSKLVPCLFNLDDPDDEEQLLSIMNNFSCKRQLMLVSLLLGSCLSFSPPSFPSRMNDATKWSTTSTIISLSSTSSSSSAEQEVPAPSYQQDFTKTQLQEGTGEAVQLGDITTVKYSCYVADSDNSMPFARSAKQKFVVGDGSMIEGWDKALRTMRVGERSLVRIHNPSLAYGAKGVPPIIPPNACVELDLQVLATQPATANIDFDQLAMADTTPRTASDIAAAFEARQAAKRMAPQDEKEGFEAFLQKAKNFYFFGLFEGETGERPPWFLQPSITFPLAFLIVGAAFYISLSQGAISERGSQVKDELDEIILSSAVLAQNPAFLVASISKELFQF